VGRLPQATKPTSIALMAMSVSERSLKLGDFIERKDSKGIPQGLITHRLRQARSATDRMILGGLSAKSLGSLRRETQLISLVWPRLAA
jgi:hypothetical protein